MLTPTPQNKRNILLIYVALDVFIVAAFVYFFLQGVALMKLLPIFGLLFLINAVAMVVLLRTPSQKE